MNVHAVVEDRNHRVRRGLFIFALFLFAFVAIINLVFTVWLDEKPLLGRHSLQTMAGLVAIILVATLNQWAKLSRDGRVVSEALGGVPIEDIIRGPVPGRKQARIAQSALAELCIAAACPQPALYVQQKEKTLNGFACGRKPEHWCITVTEGALSKLNREELQALLAHELAHLTTGDTRDGLLVCAYVAGLSSLSFLGLTIAFQGAIGDKRGIGPVVFGLAVALVGGVGWFVALLLEAALSRDQEFRADAEAIRLTRDGAGMVALLTRLAEEIVAQGSATKDEDWDASWDDVTLRPLSFSRGAVGMMFDSHPPLVERIRVIDQMAAVRVQAMLLRATK